MAESFFSLVFRTSRPKQPPETSSPPPPPPRSSLSFTSPSALQNNSIFLSQLPLEVRDQILSHLLRTREKVVLHSDDEKLRMRPSTSARVFSNAPKRFEGGVSVLCVCQQLYREGTAMLYSQNDFVCASESALETLTGSLHPAYLAQIGRLELRAWHFTILPSAKWTKSDFSAQRWAGAIARLGGMTGLKRLCVSISFMGYREHEQRSTWDGFPDDKYPKAILEPLRAITWPAVFEVYVTFPLGECEKWELESAPFRLWSSFGGPVSHSTVWKMADVARTNKPP